MMVPCITCLGQNSPTFKTVTSASGTTPQTIDSIDVNNDGSPDLIQTTLQSPFEFTVSLSDKNGSFGAPTAYAFPSGLASSPQIAFADFNGDGKVDIVASFKNEIAVYLGNGNGTFQAAKIQSNVLPSGYSFQNIAPVAADFNHDGKIDLVAIAYSTSGLDSAVVLEGNGNGTFTYKGDFYSVSSGDTIGQLAGGDFDADNNADVAISTNESCDQGAASCNGAAHVFYGNGDFGFTETTPYSTSGGLSLYSGDLNGDGRTDLFGLVGATNQLVLLYGQSNRTFTSYFNSDVPAGGVTSLAMADFNGDGHMDLVGFDFTDEPNTGATFQLAIFLSTGAEGGFKTQLYTLPYYQTDTNVVVGDYNGDTKPDILIVQNPAPSGEGSSSVAAVINTTASGNWGGCAYPKTGQGISLCTPAASSSDASPVDFKASASSFGDIRKFELWVDGKKVSEQHNNWGNYGYFDLSSTFAAGSHSATLNVTTIDNDAMDYNFKFTVPAAQ
jgi:hypothetical protein